MKITKALENADIFTSLTMKLECKICLYTLTDRQTDRQTDTESERSLSYQKLSIPLGHRESNISLPVGGWGYRGLVVLDDRLFRKRVRKKEKKRDSENADTSTSLTFGLDV